jgi:hypothetical protein
MSTGGSRWIGWGLAGAVVALAALSFDWRSGTPAPPRVVSSFVLEGRLQAGAGRAELTPPFPVPLGGYNTRGDSPSTGVLTAPRARALVLSAGGKSVALVSVELVVLPRALADKVRERVRDLPVDELHVAATHTHSGPGGYWDKALAEWVGLGGYDPRIEEFLVAQIVESVRQATGRQVPAKVSWGRIEASKFAFNRQRPGDPVDPLLTAVRVDDAEGRAIGRVVVYAAHPTILPREELRLSGDYPGSLMESLEHTAEAPVLFFQGAVGDATWGKREGGLTLPDRAVAFGRALASDARGAIAAAGEGETQTVLGSARVAFSVPPADSGGSVWGPFEAAGSNVLHWLAWPGRAEVSYLRIGPARLAFVPGELVADLGLAWRPLLGGATLVGLADDYLGYVETPARVEAEEGESVRHYFGPELANRLLEALRLAHATVDPVPAEPPAPALTETR